MFSDTIIRVDNTEPSLGDKEMENGEVAVRRYGSDESNTMAFDQFVSHITLEIEERKNNL